jgi:hypothetical protein
MNAIVVDEALVQSRYDNSKPGSAYLAKPNSYEA